MHVDNVSVGQIFMSRGVDVRPDLTKPRCHDRVTLTKGFLSFLLVVEVCGSWEFMTDQLVGKLIRMWNWVFLLSTSSKNCLGL